VFELSFGNFVVEKSAIKSGCGFMKEAMLNLTMKRMMIIEHNTNKPLRCCLLNPNQELKN
jgi:hypothetical protein